MNGDSDYSEPFSVICPRCDCRFQPSIRPTFYFAKCPECSEPVRVPAAAEIGNQEPAPEGGFSTGTDTYRIARPPGWEDSPNEEISFAPYPIEGKKPREVRSGKNPRSEKKPEKPPAAKPGEPEKPGEETPSAPPAFRVNCPGCGANFATPPSDHPHMVLCPECLEDVHVPAVGSLPPPPPPMDETVPSSPREADDDEDAIVFQEAPEPALPGIGWPAYLDDGAEPAEASVDKPKKKRRKKPKPETATAPAPAENPTRREKSSKNVFDTLAEVRREDEDPPPEWTFFSGVTDFLIRPDVAIRWLYASIGWCVMGWLCALMAHFFAEGLWMAMPFFVIPLIWIAIMTLSYTAANSMVILVETAAGIDKVEGWPDPVMKEQAVDLVYLGFLVIVGEVASFFLGGMLSVFIGPAWLVSLVLLFLLYPIVLLSSLEANSPFIPLTLPIINSLKTVTWAWGVFYGLSFALLMVWVLPLVWFFGESGWTMFFLIILLAPLASGWCFLYARLLGRLAWRASLEIPEEEDEQQTADPPKTKRPKPKKTKQGASESSGELQAAQ